MKLILVLSYIIIGSHNFLNTMQLLHFNDKIYTNTVIGIIKSRAKYNRCIKPILNHN